MHRTMPAFFILFVCSFSFDKNSRGIVKENEEILCILLQLIRILNNKKITRSKHTVAYWLQCVRAATAATAAEIED